MACGKNTEREEILLKEAWKLADELLIGEVGESKALGKPISLRHPFLFYLGHLPAFSWNTLRRHFDAKPIHDDWDYLFSRGMDPNVENPDVCHDHPPIPEAWPCWREVIQYKDDVRKRVKDCMEDGRVPIKVLRLLAEHDLMHVETLYYMRAQAAEKLPLVVMSESVVTTGKKTEASIEWVQVPSGTITIGRSDEDEEDFAWDNEFGIMDHSVLPLKVSRYPVTIAEYARFVDDGGYLTEDLWLPNDWAWRNRDRIFHPQSWRRCSCNVVRGDGNVEWHVLTVDGPVHTSSVTEWPVAVSLAEARAYARWVGARLLTEPEWEWVAWGAEIEAKSDLRGNFGMKNRHPVPVDSSSNVKSWCGVQGMVGNGWELTDTVFEPFTGFKPMEDYPEYSVDFFDKKHFVLKGASWATHPALLRRSFRNFYQAHYPFVFSKFRLCSTNVAINI